MFENEKLANSAGRSNRSPGFLVRELLALHAMTNDFEVGDHVGWNSEAGHVRGTIQKKVTSPITFTPGVLALAVRLRAGLASGGHAPHRR